MPRYLILRSFPEGLNIPTNTIGMNECLRIVDNNSIDDVTWIHSYVSTDKKQSFCIYDAPSPEAVRRAATRNNLPVKTIIEISILDPYFYL